MGENKNVLQKTERNSSVELLKIFAIFLIVTSHVVQSLSNPDVLVSSYDFMLDLSVATTDIRKLVLSMFRYFGNFGNTIFFVCSAWFLQDKEKTDKRKVLQMLMDVWLVSVIILLIVFLARGGQYSQSLS